MGGGVWGVGEGCGEGGEGGQGVDVEGAPGVRVGVGGSNGVLWVGKRAAFSLWFLGLKVLRQCEIPFSKERGY